MANWIVRLFEQLLEALDDMLDIVDWDAALQTLNAYEQIPLTKKQLQQTNILATAKDLYDQSPSEYLRYRLGLLLKMWRNIIQIDASKVHTPRRSASHSVFEAVMMDDERFFNTKSVPELLDRLLKSFDRNYKVLDMATVLHTIETLEKIKISPAQLTKTHLVTYVRRLRRNTTNRYLAKRLRDLIEKWHQSLVLGVDNGHIKHTKRTVLCK